MKIVKLLPILLLTACTQVQTPQGSYNTFGKADIMECEQMVFPDGPGGDKEAIGFNCKKYHSDGISGEAASIVSAILNLIPGMSWLRGL